MNPFDTDLHLAYLQNLAQLSAATEQNWLHIMESKDSELKRQWQHIENLASRLELAELEGQGIKSEFRSKKTVWLEHLKLSEHQGRQIEALSSRLEAIEQECRNLRQDLTDSHTREQAYKSALDAVKKTTSNILLIDDRYQISDDGQEVKDLETNLIWRRKIEPGEFKHEAALAHADSVARATGQDWRVPTAEELKTLVKEKERWEYEDAPAINTTAFPNTTNKIFWSSSAYVDNLNNAWIVDFKNVSGNYYNSRNNTYPVRLVRTGQ